MNRKLEFTVERSKPGKFQLRMSNGAESVVVGDGRANEMYDLKEAMEKVIAGAPNVRDVTAQMVQLSAEVRAEAERRPLAEVSP